MHADNRLNAIGILTRREIEARLLAPLIEALGKEFGQERVLEIVRETIIQIAHQHGQALALSQGGNSLGEFAASLVDWQKDDAMQLEILEQTGESFAFNVTRCRYAEMYQSLGVPQLGGLLSCNRDAALIAGFNPEIELIRSQTIMEGALFCDFRYTLRHKPVGPGRETDIFGNK